jgi:hypothetical protein
VVAMLNRAPALSTDRLGRMRRFHHKPVSNPYQYKSVKSVH